MIKNNILKFGVYAIIITALILGFNYYRLINKSKINNANYITQERIDPDWIEKRMNDQFKNAAGSAVRHQFKFENKLEDSGITFQHLINPDCNKYYKPVHYDHGNGITVADVDNDGFLDIYFTSQVGPGELWRNKGNGSFEDITEAAGLSNTGHKTNISASFGDIDNDGDADLYITTIRDGNFLFENSGQGTFTDISEKAKVNYHGHSSAVTFLDYNLDGLLDIFVSNVGVYTTNEKKDFNIEDRTYSYYVGFKDGFAGHLKEERFEKSTLFVNLGNNEFKNVGSELGINDYGWTGDATIIDGNDDGYPDLYVTNMQGNDLYYENQNGQAFIEKRAITFPETPWGAMGVTSFDYDNDGMQDLYITDMHSDMLGGDLPGDYMKEKRRASVVFPEDYLLTNGQSLFGNAFFRKSESGIFQEVSSRVNAENYWPWGLSNGDLNADGFEDVVITASMNYPFRFGINSVMLNDHGREFMDSEFLLGIEPREQFSKPWFTLDCAGTDEEHILCADASGEKTIWGATGSRSSVIFDLDNDGDLDIVTNEFNDPPQVLISNLSESFPEFAYLKIKLIGKHTNKNGIGAKVVVKTGKAKYTKVVTGKSGYLSQSILPLYFGLGEASKVDHIQVIWPSGKSQTIESISEINNLLVIEEEV